MSMLTNNNSQGMEWVEIAESDSLPMAWQLCSSSNEYRSAIGADKGQGGSQQHPWDSMLLSQTQQAPFNLTDLWQQNSSHRSE